MSTHPRDLSAPTLYDGPGDFPKPRRRLLRTFFHRARPIRRFAPQIHINPMTDAPDFESAAHWREHMMLEDIAIVLHRDGTMSSLRHVVSRLHGAEQLAGWDEVVRGYDRRIERTRIAAARLFTVEGRWIDAASRTHVTSLAGPVQNTYGRAIVLRYGPLRPGVIAELEEYYDAFTVHEFGPAIASQFYLHTGCPCARRRFTVAVAKPFELICQTHHWTSAPIERQDKDYRVLTWEVEQAPGVQMDEWSPPIRDFTPWIDVTTSSSWTPYARQLRRELEPWTEPDQEVRLKAKALSEGKTTARERAAAAFTYAAGSVRYGRPPVESETRNSRPTEQMLQDLRGDCKDKSALLVQLLRLMGMNAHVAAVLTGDSGRTPFLQSCRFNHAIVRLAIDEKVYWLDPAAGPFAFGELPVIDQGIYAMVIGNEAFRFQKVPVQDAGVCNEKRSCRGRLELDGNYAFDLLVAYYGEAGAKVRAQLTNRNEQHRTSVLQAWLGSDYPGAAGSQFAHASVDDLAAPFDYRCRTRLDRVARRIRTCTCFACPGRGLCPCTAPWRLPNVVIR